MLDDTSLSAQFSWVRPFIFTIAASLVVTGLARLGYVLWLGERVAETGGIGFILLQGLRFDLVSLGYLLAIPAAVTPFLNSTPRLARYWAPVLRVYLISVIGLFIFMEVATPPFISEYDIRPNYLFVEYLKYPKEVFSMLDMRVRYTTPVKVGKLTYFFELSNATNRKNECCVDFDVDTDIPSQPVFELEKKYWLPLTPALGVLWQF